VGQVNNVSTVDGVYVDDIGTNTYLIHQFGNQTPSLTARIKPTWTGRIGKTATNITPVTMQIYNFNTTLWETLATNTTATGGSIVTLNGSVSTGLTNYYDNSHYCYVRVYQ
jgi:hypothetical protein